MGLSLKDYFYHDPYLHKALTAQKKMAEQTGYTYTSGQMKSQEDHFILIDTLKSLSRKEKEDLKVAVVFQRLPGGKSAAGLPEQLARNKKADNDFTAMIAGYRASTQKLLNDIVDARIGQYFGREETPSTALARFRAVEEIISNEEIIRTINPKMQQKFRLNAEDILADLAETTKQVLPYIAEKTLETRYVQSQENLLIAMGIKTAPATNKKQENRL